MKPIGIRRRRGAALLTAMLTVALVATFAAAALWQQWRSIEVETAERARIQSSWILTGALDWSRLVLREDFSPGNQVDHLGEPWAVPLQEARLSSFLAADRNATAESGPEVMDAFLSGQIIDMQSLLNVNNLVNVDGTPNEAGRASFERLFGLLGLPPAQLDRLAENLRFARDRSAASQSGSMAPLAPQRVEQLVWLGLPPQTVSVLQPYITLLPGSPKLVNLNTASAEVIFSAVPGLNMAEAKNLVSARERSHFATIGDATKILGGPARMPQGISGVSVTTHFFEVRARIRLEQLVVEERSLLERNGKHVQVLLRERGIVDPTALSQAASKR